MIRRRSGVLTLATVAVLAVGLELVLRATDWEPALAPCPTAAASTEPFVVLAVGDSYTWGGATGYPATLAQRLAVRSVRYRVVNLAMPGSNTAQLEHRLDRYVDGFCPRVVLLWIGVNDVWNRSEDRATAPPRDAAGGLRVLALLGGAAAKGSLPVPGAALVPPIARQGVQGYRRRVLGRDESWDHTEAVVGLPESERRTTEGVRSMIARLRARGIAVVTITYPLDADRFAAANAGSLAGAAAAGAPVVSGTAAYDRLVARHAPGVVPAGLDASLHPTQPLLDEVAGLVLETLDHHHLLD